MECRDNKFLELFRQEKPIIGMIHLKGENEQSVQERAKREIDIYINQGLDGMILENYFGDYHHLEWVMDYAFHAGLPIPYGVNCLDFDAMGFELAQRYHAGFVQLDSVVGHVKPINEATLEAFLEMERSRCSAALIGGVRFKYQPVLSENTVEVDLKIAMERCDGICVTQAATGQETSMEKIEQFRNAIGDFPLIVAAGVTRENIVRQMRICDAAIVGSYFKDTGKDDGEVSPEKVKGIVDIVRNMREGEQV